MVGYCVLPSTTKEAARGVQHCLSENSALSFYRYVIDFYNAAPLPRMPLALHLDVRPALDSAEALLDRLRVQMQRTFHGKRL